MMNKLFVSLTAAAMFTLTGCDMMARPAVPVVATPTPVVTASAPAPAATATVICKDEAKSATSIANGDSARAAASCGKKAVAKAVKPAQKQKTVVASTDNSETVRALVARNAELKAQLANRQAAGAVVAGDAIMVAAAGKFAPAPSYATEGKVYSDAGGNTFQRIKGGDRLCRFFVQGELRKEQFVSGPTPEATHEMCNNLAMVFQASLTPTTPDAKVEAVLK